ncbi:Ig-like domain-containing protein [uncultured Treponema sp.]|uniref:InlB B-repeat-containing protein n=1 Tax=uncultured Treponema sp. TaxID=162155 RepID=UPI0025FCACC5|nr:Ig-like domain-containing protein [uncultured Treponema sp.]
MVSSDEGTGSTLPSGNYTAKVGYDFELSFSENSSYSFSKWIAVSKESGEEIEGVEFEDAYSVKTKAKITIDSKDIRIKPLCAERLAFAGEPSPKYEPNGVSRDRSIIVEFTKAPSKSSFIFKNSEIPSGAEEILDEDDDEYEIWAYKYNGQVFFKNISITSDGISIAEHFLRPTIEGKFLTIAVDKKNQIEFEAGVSYKTVSVTISKDITDEKGVSMSSDKSWSYRITEATDEKATVNLTSNATEGTVYLAGSKDYSIGQKITLGFTENPDYQFVKWEYNPSIIRVADEDSADTTATVMEKTDNLNATQIKAICAPRLRVSEYSPEKTKVVSKNSSIILTFSNDLPDDEEGIAQLDNITITVGGFPVKSSFLAPRVSANTVTFAADKSNMIDVASGQTKTVTVAIPADFYYLNADGKKISIGGKGFTFDYKIDSSTNEKATVTFTAASGSGKLSSTRGEYSIGQEGTISFELNEGWQFNGWTINVHEDKISIADKTALSTKIVAYDAVPAVVSANVSEKLVIRETSPSSEGTSKKDSDIVIKFNKNLEPKCAELLNKIRVSSDGNSLDAYYTTRTLDGNTITLKNTAMISVPKGSKKIIAVTVPEDLYYIDGATKISLKESSFDFTVDHSTNAKLKANFSVKNGEDGAAFSPATAAGIVNHNNYEEFNIGEDVSISHSIAEGYQFYAWEITDSDGNVVTDAVSFKDSNSSSQEAVITANKAATLNITAICYKRPSISKVSPYNENALTEFAKNEPIVLEFDHEINAETKDAVLVTYTASNFNKTTYFSTSISSDNKTVTLSPAKMLPVNNSFETVTVTVPHDKIYYMAADGKTKITVADEDFSWSYRVNSSTMTKTKVRFATTDAAVTGRQISVNGTFHSSGTNQEMNIEESLNLEFPAVAGYKFAGWKVESATSGYTVSPSGYVTSGTITVKNGSGTKTYFTLTIDSTNPAKATIFSNDAVGSGTSGWGINISAKDVLLPAITGFTPNSNNVNPKDSTITIEFNKNLDVACSSLLNRIKITMAGNDVSDFFETRSLSGNIITIKNTKLLDVTGLNTKKTITVTVPAIFYYKDGDNPIYMEEEYSGRYEIDSTSSKKVSVTYEADGGNLNVTDTSYNLGDVIDLKFTPTSGYQFTGWTVKDSAGDDIDESKIKIADPSAISTKMYIYEQVDNVTVKAESYLVPIVQSVKLNGTVDLFSVNSFNSYSNIHLKFNKEIDAASEILSPSGSITITKTGKNGIHYEEYFYERWKSSTDSTELILIPTSSFRNLVKNENNQLAMTITLNANGKSITDKDGHPLCPSEEIYNSLAINCLVSGSQETNPPVISDIHLYSTNDTSAHFYRELSNQPESSWQKILRYSNGWGTYSTNHVSSVYITLSGYDLESGIKEVQVTETYKKDNEGGYVAQETSSTRSFRIVDSYDNDTNGNTVYNYAFIYDFDSEHTTADGLFKLTISLWDNEGNKTEKDYYVIKDTQNNVRLDKILIYTKNDFQTIVPVYNSEKNCYEADFTFSEFRIYSDKFYKHYGTTYLNTSRYLTVTLYEDDVNKGEVFSSNIGTDYDLKDRINTALSNIKRDIDKDYILRAKVEQENGIIEELELPFYKSTYIAGLMGHSIYLDDRIIVTDPRENDEPILYFSTVPNPSKDEIKQYWKGTSGHDPDIDGEGTYYLFPWVIAQLGKKGHLDYAFKDYRPLCISKPFAYYNGVTAPTDDSIQFPTMTLPDSSYEAGEVIYEPNTGYATFDIDIEYSDEDYDYSQYRYIIRLDEIRDRNDASECFYDGRNIRVKTGTVKTVYLVALDSQGNECAKSDEQTLDLTLVDNQPPFITGGINNHASFNDYRNYRLFLQAWGWLNGEYDARREPYDINGLLKRSPNPNPITCYVVPKSYGVNLTKEQLDAGEFNKTISTLTDTYYNETAYLTIPYAGLDFGDYYIYSYLEDNSPLKNNYLKVAPYLMRYYIANYVPEVSFETVESVDQIKVSAQPYGRIHRRTESYPVANELQNDEQHIHGNFVNIQKLADNSWTPCVEFDSPTYQRSTIARMKDVNGTDSFYVGNIAAETRYYYSVDCSDYENQFMQVIVNYTSTVWYEGSGYGRNNFEIVQSQPLYVYPDYLRYKGTANEIVCNNKNWIVGANGYQIFTDNPVFVHTMYCSRDFSSELYAERFGTATTEQYIREWEARAQETGIVTYTGTTNTSFTYGSDNYKDIPDGYYYTTIAHFADGTTLMGEVKQK